MAQKTENQDLSEFYELSDTRCSLGKILDFLDEKNKDLFLSALIDSKVTTTGLFKWLKNKGHKTNTKSIEGHREKVCGCFRD